MNDRPDWITDEVIRLCKLIAEKYRKKIMRGDRYVHASDKKNLTILSLDHEPLSFKNLIPLWTLSDAIKWLKERYDDVNIGSIQDEWDVQTYDVYDKAHHPEFFEDIRGKTPLEPCLKIILAILNTMSK